MESLITVNISFSHAPFCINIEKFIIVNTYIAHF